MLGVAAHLMGTYGSRAACQVRMYVTQVLDLVESIDISTGTGHGGEHMLK